jgi:chromosome segregation ATPase
LQELASQKQLVQSLQVDKASLLQAQQHAEQQLTPRSSTAGAAADGASTLQQQMSPQASMQQLASPFAGQQDELASMAQQLAHSKKELQEALAAAAEMQQQARQLRLQLYSRCGCGKVASPACVCALCCLLG